LGTGVQLQVYFVTPSALGTSASGAALVSSIFYQTMNTDSLAFSLYAWQEVGGTMTGGFITLPSYNKPTVFYDFTIDSTYFMTTGP
jgi:hypothetical protein